MTLRGLRHIALYGSLFWLVSAACVQAAPPPAPASALSVARYRLQQHGGGMGIQVDETIMVFFVSATSRDPQWILERQRRDRNWCGEKSADGRCVATDIVVHDWAKSSNCPLLGLYVEGLSDFRKTGREHPSVLVTDTPLTTLEFLSSTAHGDQEVLSEYAGPLVTWWRDAEQSLIPCWTTEPPAMDG